MQTWIFEVEANNFEQEEEEEVGEGWNKQTGIKETGSNRGRESYGCPI